jgi:DNA-binding MarR family transcriptional regulator
MPTWQPDLAPLLGQIPRLYVLLKAEDDTLNADLGVTAAMRGVMASLAAGGPRTVPQLARARPVSRQHIQTVVNELAAAGLAETQANPSHRRSPLIVLTVAGQQRLRLAQQREAKLLASLAPSVSPVELAAAMRLFDRLERELVARGVRRSGQHLGAHEHQGSGQDRP